MSANGTKSLLRPLGYVDYSSSIPPAGYHCGICGVLGVKLWRDYNTMLNHQSLLCAACACEEQRRGPVELRPDGGTLVGGQRTDTIGSRVPAVPTEEGETYWGYTSVPDEGVAWWKRLPLQAALAKVTL